MTKVTTGEAEGHTHTIDTNEKSGLTSENDGHDHSYTLGDRATGPGGVNDHTHSIPDVRVINRGNAFLRNGKKKNGNGNGNDDTGMMDMDGMTNGEMPTNGTNNMKEDVPTNFAGGDPNPNIAGFDEPPFPKKKRRKDLFAGHKVFEVDSETFHKSIKGKPKFARFKNFMSLDDFPNVGNDIREFSARNPRKSIILKDSRSGRMLFLKGFK